MEKGGRKVLGKGLRALIPQGTESSPKEGGVILCPVEKLRPNEDQPRQAFDEAKLRELAESIRANGVMQPILVRRLDGGGYQIIAGERRWRAARMAGLAAVPAMVKEASGTRMLELALIENLQREDLNPLEEAEAYRQLVEEHGLTQEELSARVGKQRSTVANTLRLLKLPEEVRRMLLTGELSMGHARALLSLGSAAEQLALARRIVSGKLSVRSTEDTVRSRPGAAAAKKSSKTRRYGPAEQRLVEELQRRLATKVEISSRRRGGKIVIHYFGLEELDRVVNVILGN
ncbi:MAG: ParB/RepB/Spo0J family partition protein [Myxococcales bacterium]|nr:ParB/RepB/Spo0J family partition protein [Myxococcales bacterium]